MFNRRYFFTLICISAVGAILFFFTYLPNGDILVYDAFNEDDYNAEDRYKNVCVAYDASHRCLCFSDSVTTPFNQTEMFVLTQLLQMNAVKCCMTINAIGRLGNLMGQYATLLALSRLNRRPAFLLPEMYVLLNDYFNLSIPVMDYRAAQTFPWQNYRLHDWMLPEYGHFDGYFVKLIGYPCSWTFFNHLRDEIRREFTFHSHIRREVNEYLSHLKGDKPSVTFIGVHIRRGDYVNLMKNTYDGVLADAQYLVEAMTYFRSRHNNCLFVVCSDDLNWARENINNSLGDVVFGWFGNAYSPGYDMALLSHCNHTIMTIGTFGFWSSYLAGGDTVYLTNFTRPNSEFMKVFHYETGLLPEWTGIPARNLEISTELTSKAITTTRTKRQTATTILKLTKTSSIPTTVTRRTTNKIFKSTTISPKTSTVTNAKTLVNILKSTVSLSNSSSKLVTTPYSNSNFKIIDENKDYF